MEVFSLEEDEFNGLFITQESRNSSQDVCGEADMVSGDDLMDISEEQSECVLQNAQVEADITNSYNQQYLDISDPEDDFVNPVYGRVNK